MSEQETNSKESEINAGANAAASGSAAASGGIGASASKKETQQKKTPKKLGPKPGAKQEDAPKQELTNGDGGEEAKEEEPQPIMEKESRTWS